MMGVSPDDFQGEGTRGVFFMVGAGHFSHMVNLREHHRLLDFSFLFCYEDTYVSTGMAAVA
ncbi:MAG: hypothetical protein FD168_313 [Desulfobulbaceae bacterium]|nr:MAG: hypothetical protein FD168_313 [Desulfobulbaceae bacterium]